MSKETFYFSHDFNARADEKIKRLLAKHGYLGYGLYWALIEYLYQNANAMRTDYDSLAFDLRCEPEIIKSIVNDFGLFIVEGESFGSASVQRRLDLRTEKSEKARASAKYRWNNANALQSESDPNAIKESKGKENKVKELITSNTEDWIKDLFNGTHIESISRTTGIPQPELFDMIEPFKKSMKPIYPNQGEFLAHFKNWALKRVNEPKSQPIELK